MAPVVPQPGICIADMQDVEDRVSNTRDAIAKVRWFFGASTWSGQAADTFVAEFDANMRQLESLFAQFPAEEQRLEGENPPPPGWHPNRYR